MFLHQPTYLKNAKNYKKALESVNYVLEKEPDHAEVLFLKLKIVYEGFGDVLQAEKVLMEIIKIGPDKAPVIHRWAAHYYEKMMEMEDEQR